MPGAKQHNVLLLSKTITAGICSCEGKGCQMLARGLVLGKTAVHRASREACSDLLFPSAVPTQIR